MNDDFIKSVKQYSCLLEKWADRNPCIGEVIRGDRDTSGVLFHWPAEDDIERAFVSRTITGILEVKGACDDVELSPYQAETTFCEYILRFLIELWDDKWAASMVDCHHVYYYDTLLLRVLMEKPGKGMCYLCLRIAVDPRTELSGLLLDRIAGSRALCPLLPFEDAILNDLLAFIGFRRGADDRLRLALLLAQAIGKLSKKGQRIITAITLQDDISYLIGTIDPETCRDEVELLLEVTLCFRVVENKNPGYCKR